MDVERVAKKWAMFCRYKYDKLDFKSVVAKVIAEFPEIKKNIKEYISKIKEIVEEVSRVSKEDAERFLLENYPELLEEKSKEERKGLPSLPKAEKNKVVTRFSPAPTGPLHIGHARPILVNYLYAKMYDGKFILRIDDTDPKQKRPVPEMYEKIPEEVSWLIQDKPDEIVIQSERLEIYYDYAKRLIKMGYAYVDICSQEEISKNRREGIPCKHREQSPEENLELFEKMLNWEFKEGEAVLRIKTEIDHPNPSVRDWIAFRIIDTEKYPHPKVGSKYCVWPTYNFVCAIDDHLLGITHVLRMKEHEVNTIKQRYIYKYFNWEEPVIISFGALKVPHKSEIKKLMDEGKITDWCDPFIHTLCGLRRRGIHPEAIKKYIEDIGVTSADIEVSWDKIYRYNREIYNDIVKRYFFIENPVKVIVENLPKLEITIKNHPEKDLGERRFILNKNIIYIEKSDVNTKYLRLMEGFNIEISQREGNYITARYIDDSLETAKKLGAKIVQWVPEEYRELIKVWKPRGIVEGIGEKYIVDSKNSEVLHFIRYGFVKRESDLFIWMHK